MKQLTYSPRVETKLATSVDEMFARGLKEYNKRASWPINEGNEIDKRVKTYKGFTVGQLVYSDSFVCPGKYTEVVVIGFTKPLLKDNPFADAEARSGNYRHVWYAYIYKKRMELHHEGCKNMVSSLVARPRGRCKCGKPEQPLMQGTCGRASCKYTRTAYRKFVS